MFSKLIRYLLMLFYLFRKTSLKGLTFKEADNIVWMKVWGLKFFKADEFIDYMGIINSLSNHGVKFNIRTTNKLGRFSDKNIYIRYSRRLDPFKFNNYTHTLYFVCRQLEDQRCTVYPSSQQVLYWENKGYMTQKFVEHNIPTPKTFLITSEEEFNKIDLTFPYLIKEEHSSSSVGVHKIEGKEDLDKFFVENPYFLMNRFLIAQELLNMRRDLRVIIVGDKIVLYYWRVNRTDQWRSTVLTLGNDIVFGPFPEQWRDFIIIQFRKFNITTGAFDIVWRDDDITTTPLFLELSPNYEPRPDVDLSNMNLSYKEYETELKFRNSYYHNYVDIVFSIMNDQVSLIHKSPN